MALQLIGTPTKKGLRGNRGALLTLAIPADGDPADGDYVYVVEGVRTLNGTDNDPGHDQAISGGGGVNAWTQIVVSGSWPDAVTGSRASVDAGANNDTWEIWAWYKPWESGDLTAPAKLISEVSEPARAAVCFVVRGVDSANPAYSVNNASSTSGTTSHSLASVTIATALDWYVGCLIDDTDDASVVGGGDTWVSGSTDVECFKQSSSGESNGAFSAAISVRRIEEATSGAKSYTFTCASSVDYASLSFGIGAAVGAQTSEVDGGTGTFPCVAGELRIYARDTPPADQTAAKALALLPGAYAVVRADLSPMVLATQTIGSLGLSYGPLVGDADEASYKGKLLTFPQVRRSVVDGGRVIGGGVVPSVGSLEFSNPRKDRSGAARFDSWLTDYDWDQRDVSLTIELRSRSTGAAAIQSTQLATAKSLSLAYGSREDRLALALSDSSMRFDRQVQIVRLAGTGGDEGGPELEGFRPPIILGKAYNVPLRVLDKANQIYLVHRDSLGSAVTLDGLYVGGVQISSEDYVFTAATGTGSPTNKVQVTTDLDDSKAVTADVTGVGATTFVGDLIRWVLTTEGVGTVPAADIATDYFDVLQALVPGEAGYAILDGGPATARDVVNELTQPWAIWGMTRLGKLFVRGNFDPYYDHSDLTLPFSAVLSHQRLAPFYRFRGLDLGYKRNHHKVGEEGVAALARPTDRGRWMQLDSYRISQVTDGIDTDNGRQPSAADKEARILPLNERADANRVFGWLWDLYSSNVLVERFRFDYRALVLEPGDVITVTLDRLGISSTKMRVAEVAYMEDGVDVLAWHLPAWLALAESEGGSFVTTEGDSYLDVGWG